MCFVVLSVVVVVVIVAFVVLVLATGVVLRNSGNGVKGSKANKEEHFSADVEQFPPEKNSLETKFCVLIFL